jgi:4,5-DOPA dioxygenase extradiol
MANAIKDLQKLKETGYVMPVLFIGHGSPMNGIEENQYTAGWKNTIQNVPKPAAIVVVSAHWETYGTKVTAQAKPQTIHDFYGFPQALFDIHYRASGKTELAREIADELKDKLIELDENWGYDHGSWTILRHLYPNADVPVLQLSLNRLHTPREHYKLAKELAFLRRKGVLVIGSGNMVHNLRQVDFRQAGGHGWANEADETFKNLIVVGEHDKLINFDALGKSVALSIPTPEHYLPLLYALALQESGEPLEIFNDSVDLGSISMTSVKIG